MLQAIAHLVKPRQSSDRDRDERDDGHDLGHPDGDMPGVELIRHVFLPVRGRRRIWHARGH
jgi:hypothetical protein